MSPSSVALNTNETRNRNLAAVFEAVRDLPGRSRSEIGKGMPFSLQTMTNVVQELIDIGLVEEFDREQSARKRGNQHRGLRVVKERCYSLGVQFRWNSCFLALVDLTLGVVDRKSWLIDVPYDDSQAYLLKLEECIEAFLSCHSTKDIWAIGLSGPLPIEVPHPPPHAFGVNGRWLDQKWFHGFFSKVTVAEMRLRLRRRFERPVMVLNNVQSAAIAEANRLPHDQRFIYLLAGMSLGASFVVNRALNPETWPQGGELGHVIYRDQMISTVLSASGVRHRLGFNFAQGEFQEKLEVLVEQTPEIFMPWVEEAAAILRFLVNFVENALWPDGIALAGFLPDKLLDLLIEAVFPLPISVVLPQGDPQRTMPRLYRAYSGSANIPVGAAIAVLNARNNVDFASLIAAHRHVICGRP
ncbi:hypothetical protein [Martelella sp. FOR1707]